MAGVDIDDDNEPAPENVPVPAGEGQPPAEQAFSEWGHDGSCYRKLSGGRDTNASINFPTGVRPTMLQLFEMFFMKNFVMTVLVPEINKKIVGDAVSYGEFLRWIGLWLMMATIQGPQRSEFWSIAPVSLFDGAPFRLNNFMSRSRFDAILFCLKFTSSPPPTTYRDKFWEIREMLEAWNKNMQEHFVPSWVSCLDESMSTWTNKFTCPGFMFVPRKPWPFGNEYHTMSCAKSDILYSMELVEGKDQPKEGPHKDKAFDNLGRTVGLLLRLTTPIWHQARTVILDSGFCVLKGIIELKKKGVYAGALIKKRRYWPKHIRGDDIREHFANKEVGDTNSWKGNLEGVPFHVYAMKEPDYVMSIMSTYGTNERIGEKISTRKWKEGGQLKTTHFKYPEVIYNHFKYRHSIDDHNSKRHSPISLEVVWKTQHWPCRVFTFLLAVTEVNTMLGISLATGSPREPMLNFRRKLAQVLIDNPYLAEESERDRRRSARVARSCCHELRTLPKKRKFDGSEIVISESDYPQTTCVGRHKKIRTYCRCSPGVYRCAQCFSEHLFAAQNETPSSD